jgi:hypothetical protein
MNKLKRLSHLLNLSGLQIESGQIISLASRINRMDFAEREGSLDDIDPYEPTDLEGWMKWVASDLSDILKLHYPAFLGMASRAKIGGVGAYAFSAANNAGYTVVMKIVLARDIPKYKEILSYFGSSRPPVIPEIFSADYFSDLGYTQPRGVRESYGVVVMEELERLPSGLGELLTKPAYDNESLRILINNPEVLRAMSSRVVKAKEKTIKAELETILKVSPERLSEIISEVIGKLSLGIFEMISGIKVDDKNITKEKDKWIRYVVRNSLDESLLSTIELKNLFGNNPGEVYRVRDLILNEVTKELIREFNSVPSGYYPEEDYDESFDAAEYNLDIPGAKGFSESLKELKNLGINPTDLHSDNLMIRPKTGEIVIADLGNFSFV